jgi:hypothetical protein
MIFLAPLIRRQSSRISSLPPSPPSIPSRRINPSLFLRLNHVLIDVLHLVIGPARGGLLDTVDRGS